MSAIRASRLTLVLSAAAITLVALAGCSLGAPHSARSTATTKTPSATPSSSASADASAKGGCPAGIEDGLKQVTSSGTEIKVGSVDDLAFPGDAALFSKACIVTTQTAQGTSAIAIVPGDASVAAQIEAPIEAAGFSALTKSDTTAFYQKGKESWIVSTQTSGTPLPSGVGSAFSGPHLTVAHTVTP